MDKNDPNQWTTSFIRNEPQFCMNVLREINATVAGLVEERNFAPAIAGLDRIVNGLITFQNAGGEFKPHICFFSWVEAEVVAFGVEAPVYKRRETAIQLFRDAYDYASGQTVKQSLGPVIEALQGGIDLDELREGFDPEFPDSIVDMLGDLHSKLTL